MSLIDSNSKKIVRKYLQESLSKFGYVVNHWSAEVVSIKLNTYTIHGQPDIIRLAFMEGCLHYVDTRSGKNTIILDDTNRIGRLADPDFADKVASFVKNMHRVKLAERMELYKRHIVIVEDEIDLIDNPPE